MPVNPIHAKMEQHAQRLRTEKISNVFACLGMQAAFVKVSLFISSPEFLDLKPVDARRIQTIALHVVRSCVRCNRLVQGDGRVQGVLALWDISS